jgi:hypothetical protein
MKCVFGYKFFVHNLRICEYFLQLLYRLLIQIFQVWNQLFVYMKEGFGLKNMFKKVNILILNKIYWWSSLEYLYIKFKSLKIFSVLFVTWCVCSDHGCHFTFSARKLHWSGLIVLFCVQYKRFSLPVPWSRSLGPFFRNLSIRWWCVF